MRGIGLLPGASPVRSACATACTASARKPKATRAGPGSAATCAGFQSATCTAGTPRASAVAKAERAASDVEMMIEMKVSFDEDRALAFDECKIWSALALSGEQKMGVEDAREMEKLALEVEDVAHRRWLVSDDPDEHIEQIRPYLEWGFNHLVFHFPGDDQERAMVQYAEHILPHLRAEFGE